jgi:hypothetical protein
MTFSINTLNIKTKRSKPSWDDLIINQFCVSISHQNVSCQDLYRTWQYRRSMNCLPFARTWVHPQFFGDVRVAHLFSFLCCPIMCLYVLSSVLKRPLRFLHKTIFGSSLPPVVCRRVHTLFALVVFVCL